MESVAASIVNECEVTTAWLGLTENIPKPNAAIAVIAIRLKNVVFDITFLSIVVDKTFLSAADRGFASILWGNARATAPHSLPCIRTRRRNLK
jgi:hypothetical protein